MDPLPFMLHMIRAYHYDINDPEWFDYITDWKSGNLSADDLLTYINYFDDQPHSGNIYQCHYIRVYFIFKMISFLTRNNMFATYTVDDFNEIFHLVYSSLVLFIMYDRYELISILSLEKFVVDYQEHYQKLNIVPPFHLDTNIVIKVLRSTPPIGEYITDLTNVETIIKCYFSIMNKIDIHPDIKLWYKQLLYRLDAIRTRLREYLPVDTNI